MTALYSSKYKSRAVKSNLENILFCFRIRLLDLALTKAFG